MNPAVAYCPIAYCAELGWTDDFDWDGLKTAMRSYEKPDVTASELYFALSVRKEIQDRTVDAYANLVMASHLSGMRASWDTPEGRAAVNQIELHIAVYRWECHRVANACLARMGRELLQMPPNDPWDIIHS